eukprot:TRINITY_DN4166_c0_g1_i2.p1 TRINITY_DN4166_c0_g1~~TRINITY_DN4166_c0_g1_i2.p1  ORF type:complete len:142 (-),score=34.65 TRINITY_DN4166_c0_g1_i2:684-1109(-)
MLSIAQATRAAYLRPCGRLTVVRNLESLYSKSKYPPTDEDPKGKGPPAAGEALPAAAEGGANASHRPSAESEKRDSFSKAAISGGVEGAREKVEKGTAPGEKAKEKMEDMINSAIHTVEKAMPGSNKDLPDREFTPKKGSS